jgi:hypothetical protein
MKCEIKKNKNVYITPFDLFHAIIFISCFRKNSVQIIQHQISPEEIGLLITVYAVTTRIQDD